MVAVENVAGTEKVGLAEQVEKPVEVEVGCMGLQGEMEDRSSGDGNDATTGAVNSCYSG